MFTRIEEIEVWKRGLKLAVAIYHLTSKEPLRNDWGLRDQLRKSAISIPSNIAEGYDLNYAFDSLLFLETLGGRASARSFR
ncbi:MAG: four helix bundle protein, partial [Calditrichota bacterium]